MFSTSGSRLTRLPSLVGSRRRGTRAERLPALPAAPREPRDEDELIGYPVRPPFYSSWEVWLDSRLRRIDPYWEPQVQFGRKGEPGSTEADWVHPLLHVALYLDGPSHDVFQTGPRDAANRARLEAIGYRVVAWFFGTFGALKASWLDYYRRDLGG